MIDHPAKHPFEIGDHVKIDIRRLPNSFEAQGIKERDEIGIITIAHKLCPYVLVRFPIYGLQNLHISDLLKVPFDSKSIKAVPENKPLRYGLLDGVPKKTPLLPKVKEYIKAIPKTESNKEATPNYNKE